MKAQITGRFALADFELESYLCDDLPPERRAHVERAIAGDPDLRAYIREREQQRADFPALHPLRSAVAAGVDADAGPRARRWLGWAAAAAAAIAVPAVALLWWSGAPPDPRQPARPDTHDTARLPDTVRIKGTGIAAELYVKRGEQVFRHRAEQPLKPGDRVRLSVDAPAAGYLSLLARDEHGALSVYYDRLPLPAGRFTVPDSLLLDASRSDELWLVVVASEARPAQAYAGAFGSDAIPKASYALIPVHKEKP